MFYRLLFVLACAFACGPEDGCNNKDCPAFAPLCLSGPFGSACFCQSLKQNATTVCPPPEFDCNGHCCMTGQACTLAGCCFSGKTCGPSPMQVCCLSSNAHCLGPAWQPWARCCEFGRTICQGPSGAGAYDQCCEVDQVCSTRTDKWKGCQYQQAACGVACMYSSDCFGSCPYCVKRQGDFEGSCQSSGIPLQTVCLDFNGHLLQPNGYCIERNASCDTTGCPTGQCSWWGPMCSCSNGRMEKTHPDRCATFSKAELDAIGEDKPLKLVWLLKERVLRRKANDNCCDCQSVWGGDKCNVCCPDGQSAVCKHISGNCLCICE